MFVYLHIRSFFEFPLDASSVRAATKVNLGNCRAFEHMYRYHRYSNVYRIYDKDIISLAKSSVAFPTNDLDNCTSLSN